MKEINFTSSVSSSEPRPDGHEGKPKEAGVKVVDAIEPANVSGIQ